MEGKQKDAQVAASGDWENGRVVYEKRDPQRGADLIDAPAVPNSPVSSSVP